MLCGQEACLACAADGGGGVQVHAMGRDSGGCAFDIKGLVSPVTLNGESLPTLQD